MKTKQKIEEFLKQYNINNYTINDDLSVDVDGDVNLSEQNFEELPVNFGKVTGYFYCESCPNLITLEGAPKEMGKNLWCCSCINLISLKGFPKEIVGYFGCYKCSQLSSLQYAPLKCKIDNFKDDILKGTNINTIEADKYLLKRILLGDFSLIKEYSNKNKIKPLLTMRDFDLI